MAWASLIYSLLPGPERHVHAVRAGRRPKGSSATNHHQHGERSNPRQPLHSCPAGWASCSGLPTFPSCPATVYRHLQEPDTRDLVRHDGDGSAAVASDGPLSSRGLGLGRQSPALSERWPASGLVRVCAHPFQGASGVRLDRHRVPHRGLARVCTCRTRQVVTLQGIISVVVMLLV